VAHSAIAPYAHNWFLGSVMPRIASLALAVLALITCQMPLRNAGAAESGWWTDCRHGWITKEFEGLEGDNPPVEIAGTAVRITYDELRNLVKELPFILRKVKACDAYRKCLDDRDAGKVKHCYYNDRRWREFYTGAW
jgi:hypothetical protein